MCVSCQRQIEREKERMPCYSPRKLSLFPSGILSKVLKKLLNQSRPPELETSKLELIPSDGGMPSSHAMSLGFIGIFTALNLPSAARIPLVLYVAVSLYYRVKIVKLHTWEQIVVGLIAGTFNGVMWYKLCTGEGDINIMNWVSSHLLDEGGILPLPYLVVPAAMGLIVVGSVERRIGRWLKNKKK